MRVLFFIFYILDLGQCPVMYLAGISYGGTLDSGFPYGS